MYIDWFFGLHIGLGLCACSDLEGQQRALDPLKQELQTEINNPIQLILEVGGRSQAHMPIYQLPQGVPLVVFKESLTVLFRLISNSRTHVTLFSPLSTVTTVMYTWLLLVLRNVLSKVGEQICY